MGWSKKYKKSIDCNNPKGFSQKAHCQGRKKRNESKMKLSEFKEAVRGVLRERSINAISKLQSKNLDDIAKALEFYKKNKHTDKKEAFVKVLKKLGKEKERLAKELDMKVSGMYKNAEYQGESVNEASSEPQIITQLRDVVKNGYKTLKDPKTGKKMKVDSYSASAITQVYDAINQSNKDKFVKGGLLGMQNMAFKVIKR